MQAVVTYGLPRDVTPQEALLAEVRRSAGAVEWLAGKVAELAAEDVVVTGYGPGVNPWVHLFRAERRHLGEVCRAAIVSCAAESAAASAAKLGGQVADVLDRVLAGLRWDERDEVLRLFGEEFRRLHEQGGSDG